MTGTVQKYRAPLIYVLLAFATLAVFWPTLTCEFVKYDDDKYVTDNPRVAEPITVESVTRAFTRPHYHMWHPLTTLSYMLDYRLFGLNPLGFHLTNLLLHTAAVLLLFAALNRITGAVWPSALVAAVFALHPLQVESVAWVAERKNVLSGLFWMLSLLAYVRYAQRPRIGRYVLLLLSFCLGLMAKPMLVTLPFVLLLLDYWPLDRLEVSDRNKPRRKRRKAAAAVPCPRFSARLLLAEKVPLFLMSAVVSVITYASVHAGRVISDIETVPLNRRLANAAVSYVTYIAKMLWPARLAVFYPYPRGHYSVGSLILSILLLVLITVGLAYAGRTRRYLVTGWLWYVGVLVPVIGLIQAGAQSMADRYMYLPMVGLLLICVWGFNDLLAGWRLRRTVAVLSAVVLLPAASVCTRLQLRHWQNSEALFRRALSVTSDNYVMHNNYANLLHKLGKTDLAIEHYRQCLRIRQDSPEAHNNLGNALTAKGLTDEAVVHYNRAIQLARDAGRARGRPAGLAEAHHNLANALRIQGRFHEARQQYNEALKIRPDNPDTLRGLGLTLAALKMFDEAVRCYDRAIEIEPDNIISRGLLGLALANKGMTDQAIEQFRLVLDERPNDVEMLCNLGVLLESQDKTEQAIRQYERALKADPAFAKAQHLLEVALKRRRSPQQSDPLKTPAPTPRDPPSSAPN